MCVKDPQTLSSRSPRLCFVTFLKFSGDPQCGIISPLYPSSGSLSASAPSFPASPPPELCLPPLCLHFPPTFLSHSKELSVSVLPFIYCFNMLAGGERGGCCAHPSVLSCHPSGQCRLSLTPTQLPVVSAWRTLKRRCGRKRRGIRRTRSMVLNRNNNSRRVERSNCSSVVETTNISTVTISSASSSFPLSSSSFSAPRSMWQEAIRRKRYLLKQAGEFSEGDRGGGGGGRGQDIRTRSPDWLYESYYCMSQQHPLIVFLLLIVMGACLALLTVFFASGLVSCSFITRRTHTRTHTHTQNWLETGSSHIHLHHTHAHSPHRSANGKRRLRQQKWRRVGGFVVV